MVRDYPNSKHPLTDIPFKVYRNLTRIFPFPIFLNAAAGCWLLLLLLLTPLLSALSGKSLLTQCRHTCGSLYRSRFHCFSPRSRSPGSVGHVLATTQQAFFGRGKRLPAGILVALAAQSRFCLTFDKKQQRRANEHVAGMGPLRLRLHLRPGRGTGEQQLAAALVGETRERWVYAYRVQQDRSCSTSIVRCYWHNQTSQQAGLFIAPIPERV